MTTETNTRELLEFIEARGAATDITVTRGAANEAPVLVVPNGLRVESVKKYLDEMRVVPERRTGTARLVRLKDFIAHVNRFKTPDTAVFVDPDAPSALAIYDYHPAGGDVFNAANRGHGASHVFPLSSAYKAWRGISGKAMSAKEFSAFIVEHAAEILSPSEAEACAADLAALDLSVGTPDVMRRLAKGLRVSVNEDFEESRALENGDVAISFARKTTGTKDAKGTEIKVPGGIVVGVPVLDGADTIAAIPAILRFDYDGSLTWTVTLMHLDTLMRSVVDGAAEQVAAETGCPVFYGATEK